MAISDTLLGKGEISFGGIVSDSSHEMVGVVLHTVSCIYPILRLE